MKNRAAIFLGVTLFALCSLMFSMGLFSSIENALSDRLFSPHPVDETIHIIAIDNETLDTLGQWPLPRATFATVLEHIIKAEPRAIGIDVVFTNPSRLGPTDDQALEKVLRESPVPIILPVEGVTLRIQGTLPPEAESLIETKAEFSGDNISYGHINLIRDRDGLVRRIPLLITHNERRIESFSGKVVGKNERNSVEKIVFSGEPGTVESSSFFTYQDGSFDSSTIRGKYVFIGATAADLHDEQPTPTSAGTAMSGVEIQAQVANMLLQDYHLIEIPKLFAFLWISILVLIPLLSFFFIRQIGIAFLISSLLFIVNLILVTQSFKAGYVISIVHTILPLLLSSFSAFSYRYFILEKERREIRGVFSKYVSKAVLEELLKNPSAVALGGTAKEITIFFSDIRGFTTLSEKLTPAALTTLLNRYLTRMTDIVLENDGVVDKYIGDAIMAFWGAPLPNSLHAKDAIMTSLSMLTALDAFNEECARNGESPIHIGIGLNTGEVIVGNMGSTQRFDYTVMGDAVNLASRIEGQTKTYGVRLLVSKFTRDSVERADPAHPFLFREIDKVAVKGKAEPVSLFEVVEPKREAFVRSVTADFELLLQAYYKGAWKEAVAIGKQILAQGDDGPTNVLYERAMLFEKQRPEGWRGVYELTSK